MKQTLRTLLDVLFPLRADADVVAKLTEKDLMQLYKCTKTDGIVWLLPFSDTRIRACIHEVKFHDSHKATQLLSGILLEYLQPFSVPDIILVPIPLSSARLRSRGYNQVVRIASKIAGLNIEQRVLQKVKDTVPQTMLSRTKRMENVKDAFAIADNAHVRESLKNKHIIVLDDVFTTGATLREARSQLQSLKPASITCVALAH